MKDRLEQGDAARPNDWIGKDRGTGSLVTCGFLAVTSTLLSGGISAAAGWSRGDNFLTSIFWAGLGLLATAAAHLLLAAARNVGWPMRVTAGLLWVFCVAFAIFSHASYFLASQELRGQQRATVATDAIVSGSRPISAILAARAKLEGEQVALELAECAGDCIAAKRKARVLRLRIAALDQETEESRQALALAAAARIEKERAREDPVVAAAAEWLGVSSAPLKLSLGLLAGLLLDGVGCVCWAIVFSLAAQHRDARPARSSASEQQGLRARASAELSPVTGGPVDAIAQDEQELNDRKEALLELAVAAVASGEARSTVRSLRSYLNCSQQTATELNRALKSHSLSA